MVVGVGGCEGMDDVRKGGRSEDGRGSVGRGGRKARIARCTTITGVTSRIMWKKFRSAEVICM